MSKILIVEDDTYLLKLYSEIFEKENFEVMIAEDGREALQKIQDFKPDVMLLDLMLPYVDGFKVLEDVKKNPTTAATKVVVLTNLDSETQKQKALKLGAEKFMVKSSNNPDFLVDLVKKVITPE